MYVVAEIRVTVQYMYIKIVSVAQECFYGKFFTSNNANFSCHFSEINYLPRKLHFFHTLHIKTVLKKKFNFSWPYSDNQFGETDCNYLYVVEDFLSFLKCCPKSFYENRAEFLN